MQTIAASILNYGTSSQTIECVRSVLAAHRHSAWGVKLSIWVADNGSVSDDCRALRIALQDFPEVTLRLHDHNLGFAAGHNRNVEAILASSRPDFVWLLNNDCVVERGCVEALLECANNDPGVGIWGATLLEPGGQTIQCAGGCFYNSWLSSYRQYGHGCGVEQRDSLAPVRYSYVSGASLFLPVSTLEGGLIPPAKLEVGHIASQSELLNEELFLYFEELDLAKRLMPELTLGWCRDALVTHSGGGSTGSGERRRSAKAEYHSSLSALKFTRLYYPRRLWLMAPARFFAKSAQLLFTGNIRLFSSLTAAYVDFWKWLHHGGL